jgi:hypothetical protein
MVVSELINLFIEDESTPLVVYDIKAGEVIYKGLPCDKDSGYDEVEDMEILSIDTPDVRGAHAGYVVVNVEVE